MKKPQVLSTDVHFVKSRLGRNLPDRSGIQGQRHLLDSYEVAGLIEVDGEVPLNYFTYTENFGDLLSPWLVQKLSGKPVRVADRKKPHYVVIGSIANQGTEHSILWGTGMYGTESKQEVAVKARYLAVRGPLTRAKLSASKGFGAKVPKVYGDPALLLPLLHWPKIRITHEYGVCVRWSEREWRESSYGPGVKLIDFSRTDVEGVIEDMLSCRRILTSSLHGLVLADAYNIPSAWLASSSPRGGEFKYYDYFASVQKWRIPQELDLTKGRVTAELLRESFTFNSSAIIFDYAPLLDACPFLKRKSSHNPALPRRESGGGLRELPGTCVLLPSLGAFGGIGASFLSVPINGSISKISFFLPSDVEGQLDLRGIQIYSGSRKITVDPTCVKITQSSSAISADRDRDLFSYGVVRTKREQGPWLTVQFSSLVDVTTLRVYNRRNGYGKRSRALSVAVADGKGKFFSTISVDSGRVIEETLHLLTKLSGIPLDPQMLQTPDAAKRARAEVLSSLASRARGGLLTADAEEQRLLSQVLHTAPLAKGDDLTDDEWCVMGHVLASQRLRISGTATSMAMFQFVLDRRARLERLTDEVNEASALIGSTPVMLTRHGYSEPSALRMRSEDYLATLDRATQVLENLGFPVMIGYGTLLGAMREGDFIAHDDDIDLLIPFEAADRTEVEPQLSALRQRLQDQGWGVDRPNSYTNFHLKDPISKLHVDVFPLLIHGDRTSLHMERMILRDIPTDIVLPPSSMTFKGHVVGIPALPEAFLEERYGSGWTVVDPYYDWPWKLVE